MSEAFDPYHKWLAIPAREQPPDHYRLLAIERFESDLDVISHAADQRMSHIKRFQSGPHAALSQKLLNEIAKASSCLLDAESKAKYDADLAAAAAPSRPAPRPQAERSAPIARAVEIAAAPVQTTTRPHHSRSLKKAKKRQSNIRWLGHIVAPIAGLVLGYIILSLARPDLSIFSRSSESNGESPEVAVTDDVDSGESRRPKGKSRRPRNKQRDQANTGATDSATKDSSPEGGTDGAIDPSQDPSQQNGTHPNGTETDGGTDGEVKDPANGGDIEPPPQPTQEEIVAQLKTELDTAVTAGDIPAALTATDKLANYAEDPLALRVTTFKRLLEAAADRGQQKRVAEAGLAALENPAADSPKAALRELANVTLLAARRADDVDLQRKVVLRLLALQDPDDS